MEMFRTALALLCTKDVTPADWAGLVGAEPADIAADLRAGGPLLAHLLGKRVGPTDWRRVDEQLDRCARAHARGIAIWDSAYPAWLRAAPFAPPLLFARGRVETLSRPCVAMVGTRAPSVAGITFAHRLARHVATAGVCVVSGLARGIDTAAHQGALAADGNTVAVLGTGIDVAYPRENADLMERIAQTGCVISEQMCGTHATAHVFPRRNRIISGLSQGVLVVEGGLKSGALITARWALQQGRDVGAVPGFPGDFRSAGPNQLLRDGAFLVESARDIWANLPRLAPAQGAQPESAEPGGRDAPRDGDSSRVLGLIASGAMVDEITSATGLDAARVQEILSRLEIDGVVVRDGPGRFVRAPRGE
jgi:DNA processing protein